MKIYTKTGDEGTTTLWGGQRVEKNAPRIVAYGTVDELNALLGVVRSSGIAPALDGVLARVQNELFVLGADLATPGETTRIERIDEPYTARLEQEIDEWEAQLQPLRQFILPGGSLSAAYLHLARTVCRRAEREVTGLALQESVNADAQAYLNRLSDWLFVLARTANAREGVDDVPWNKP